MSNQGLYLYPVWLRIWHGVNALGIILLIFTGISMQYGNIDYPLLPFKVSVMIHNISGIVVSIGYVVFAIAKIIQSGLYCTVFPASLQGGFPFTGKSWSRQKASRQALSPDF